MDDKAVVWKIVIRSVVLLAVAGVGQVASQTPNQATSTQDTYTALVPVNIRCVNDPTNGLSCAAEYPDQCREQWNFANPCTEANIARNITKFVHPFDATKFLMCGDLGKLYVVQCPRFELFHEGCGQCVGERAGLTASCELPLPAVTDNPCTRQAILENKLFFPFPGNLSKFIHCDIWGKAWERMCTPGEVWSQWDIACVLPSLINPCNRAPVADASYMYRHPCDMTMYLQCDSFNVYSISCGAGYLFQEHTQTCVPAQEFKGKVRENFCDYYTFGFRTYNDMDQSGKIGGSQGMVDVRLLDQSGRTAQGGSNSANREAIFGAANMREQGNAVGQGENIRRTGSLLANSGTGFSAASIQNQGNTSGQGGNLRRSSSQSVTQDSGTSTFNQVNRAVQGDNLRGSGSSSATRETSGTPKQSGQQATAGANVNAQLASFKESGSGAIRRTAINESAQRSSMTSSNSIPPPINVETSGGIRGSFRRTEFSASSLGASGDSSLDPSQTNAVVQSTSGSGGSVRRTAINANVQRSSSISSNDQQRNRQDSQPPSRNGGSVVRSSVETSAQSRSSNSSKSTDIRRPDKISPFAGEPTVKMTVRSLSQDFGGRNDVGTGAAKGIGLSNAADALTSQGVRFDVMGSGFDVTEQGQDPLIALSSFESTQEMFANRTIISAQETGSGQGQNSTNNTGKLQQGSSNTQGVNQSQKSGQAQGTAQGKFSSPGQTITRSEMQSSNVKVSVQGQGVPVDQGFGQGQGSIQMQTSNLAPGQRLAQELGLSPSQLDIVSILDQRGGTNQGQGQTQGQGQDFMQFEGSSQVDMWSTAGGEGGGSVPVVPPSQGASQMESWAQQALELAQAQGLAFGSGQRAVNEQGARQGNFAERTQSSSFFSESLPNPSSNQLNTVLQKWRGTNAGVSQGTGSPGGLPLMANDLKLHPSQLKEYPFSKKPYSEPCTTENTNAGRYYFRVQGEPHNYIQCDTNGIMHKRICSTNGRDWFDVYSQTCVDGPIHVDNLVIGHA
ncbi:hypothetical protein DPMN_144642 [Dreissena polymorpha]|uniref:Chitin-binding type-2 domain-containing protein n=1 Tax=Dreissena polymorpha TaxID=45954 RepID=A0A9D4F8C9_DREPO|nr:hypothetical protein DPMN_144642 [Dreissena polymorpha]